MLHHNNIAKDDDDDDSVAINFIWHQVWLGKPQNNTGLQTPEKNTGLLPIEYFVNPTVYPETGKAISTIKN